MPSLKEHLDKLGCDMFIIAMPWFLCMFARNLPPETTARVWDALFLEGSKIFFRVSLALLKVLTRLFVLFCVFFGGERAGRRPPLRLARSPRASLRRAPTPA